MLCASVLNARFSSFASFAIRCCFVETVCGLGVPSICPSSSSMLFRRPLPSTGSSRVSSPASRYYEALRIPVARPAAASLFARGPVPPSSVFRSPQSRTHLYEARVVLRLPQPALRWKQQGLPGSCPTRCYVPRSETPPVLAGPHLWRASKMLPSGRTTPSAPEVSFRGSIARPIRSLSTLRSLRHRTPRKTRFRLAGFALAGRD